MAKQCGRAPRPGSVHDLWPRNFVRHRIPCTLRIRLVTMTGPDRKLPTLYLRVPWWLLLKVPVATVRTGTFVRVGPLSLWTWWAVAQLLTTGTRMLTSIRLHRFGVVAWIPLMVTVLPLVALILKLQVPRTLMVTLWPSLPLLVSRTRPFVKLAGLPGNMFRRLLGSRLTVATRELCRLDRNTGPG